ncbi:MAG: hypothetical protein FWD61_19180 [Phycisphaerales bacterium]|nr:hypothetical protein [Phycisphaerales bacterium]
MKRFINSQFDVPLTQLKAEGLTWLPWVGKDYTSESEHRILIVGESHYAKNDEEEAQRISSESYTQEVIFEYPICDGVEWEKRNPTFDNLHKALFGASPSDLVRTTFWSSVAYYNFVQRLMRYVAPVERPSWDDGVKAWAVFERVIRILKPHLCIFIGVFAADSFDFAMNQLAIPHEPVEKHEIGHVFGRTASITIDDHRIGLIFMQHAGKYFSWPQWNRFLLDQGGSPLHAVISKAAQHS